jgi:hypothetical protein
VQLSPDGLFYINTFSSAIEATEKLGISYGHISSCVNGKRAISGGYKWVFEEEYDYNLPTSNKNDSYYQKLASQISKTKSAGAKFVPVAQYSLEGNFIQIYDSIKSASISTGTDRISLGQCCRLEIKSANGFLWRYANETPEVKITPYLRKKRFDSYEVAQYDINGDLICIFSSLDKVKEVADRTAVYDVINGKSKTAGGYQWQKYSGQKKIEPLYYETNRGKKVQQIDIKSDKVINEYDSLSDASIKTGYSKSTIGKAAKGDRKTANGFKWKYK